jgi:GNAT superfamily N-acetyltransferase
VSILTPSPLDRETTVCSVLSLTYSAQFEYRFTKCGGLCLGLFTSVDTSDSSAPLASLETASSAHHVYSGAPARKSVLLAHCVVTKTANSTVQDEDMEVPGDWKTSSALAGNVGHQEEGRTVAVHSLAVLPSLQNRGLGSTLLKAFVQRLGYVQAADRVVLLAHGDLVKFYEKLGFENKGPSKATFGGGDWVDMASLSRNPAIPQILTKWTGPGTQEQPPMIISWLRHLCL